MAGRAPVVVFAVGNPSRGDDAIGPTLLAWLEGWLAGQGRVPEVDLVEDFQLQIEHAIDLEHRRLALFIDAGQGTPVPFDFAAIMPRADWGHSTHALEPQQVLAVYAQTNPTPPPAAFVLCVRGESFELGAPLSAVARDHCAAAQAFLQRLLSDPDPAAWARWAA